MKKLGLLSIVLGSALAISSCGDSDGDKIIPALPGAPTVEIGQEFAKLFPGVTEVEWKSAEGGYQVASFKTKGLTKGNTLKATTNSLKSGEEEYSTEGWFSSEASCDMVESEVTMETIPQAIVDAWEKTEDFKDKCPVTDVDYIIYRSKPIYKIETEYYPELCYLFFNPDGDFLFKDVLIYMDEEEKEKLKNKDNKPVPSDVHSYIENLYPGYIVADYGVIDDIMVKPLFYYSVIHDYVLYKIEFDTETRKFHREYADLKLSKLPLALQDAIKVIDPSANDDNTGAERVRTEKEDSTSVYEYLINSDFEGLAGKAFDGNGNEI